MIRARKLSALLAMLLVAIVVLTACGPKQSNAPKEQPKDQPAAQKGPAVGGTVNLVLEQDPDNFNPILSSTAYGSAVHGLVYSGLVDFNTKWEPIPDLAKSWETSTDGLTWTFHLRQGVKFTDGNELTADDVVYTLNAIKDKDYQGPRDLSAITSITAGDKYTVIVKIDEPYAPLLGDISYGILEKKLFETTSIKDMDKNPTTMNPVGTGPYKFIEYKRGQYVLMERNQSWFRSQEEGGGPWIDKIMMKIIPDGTTATAALENGEVDDFQPAAGDVSRMLKDDKGKLIDYNYERNGWGYMTLNTASPILSDKLVRQALTYGLDRQSIIDGVMDGRAVIPAGPIPPVSWAFDSSIKPYPYDKTKAGQLLDQAGWKMGSDGIREKDGKKLKLGFYGTAGNTTIEGLTAIAKKNWKDIGVDLDVQLMDFNAMMTNYVKTGKFDISFSGMSLSLDPDQYDLWHSKMFNGFNRGKWNNAKNDELLVKGRTTVDPAKRKQIYADWQKNFVEEAPAILIYANKYTEFVSARIKGVVNFPGSGPAFIYKWYINEK